MEASEPFDSSHTNPNYQNPTTSTIENIKDPKKKRAMEQIRDGVFEKIAETYPNRTLTFEDKALIEQRLLILLPDFHTPNHPTYALMILRAINELREEGGSSEEAISRFIKTEYDDLPLAHRSLLKRHLAKLCEKGEIFVTDEKRYMLPTLSTTDTKRLLQNKKQKQGKRSKKQGRSRRRKIAEEEREQSQPEGTPNESIEEQNQQLEQLDVTTAYKSEGICPQDRKFATSGEENELTKQSNELAEEQNFTRAAQLEEKQIDVNEKQDQSQERRCELSETHKLAEVQQMEVPENQYITTEEQNKVVKEVIRESDGGDGSPLASLIPNIHTPSHLTHGSWKCFEDKNLHKGQVEAIGPQIQSEAHQNELVGGDNQPQEQLDAIKEQNQDRRWQKGEFYIFLEQNESRGQKNDIIEEQSLPTEQIVGWKRKLVRSSHSENLVEKESRSLEKCSELKKRKSRHNNGETKVIPTPRRSKRLQILPKEHESDGTLGELDKSQQGEIEADGEQNRQGGLEIESMEEQSQENEELSVISEQKEERRCHQGGETEVYGEQNESNQQKIDVDEEQSLPQEQQLEMIKEQVRKLGAENLPHEQHSKLEVVKIKRKETTLIAARRRSKRLENILKEQVSDGLLSQSEKSQLREIEAGAEQNQQEDLQNVSIEEQNQACEELDVIAEQNDQRKWGRTEACGEQIQSKEQSNDVVDRQSLPQEKQPEVFKEQKMQGQRRKWKCGLPGKLRSKVIKKESDGDRQGKSQQKGKLELIGKPIEPEGLQNESVEVQSHAKERLDVITKQTQETRCQEEGKVEESVRQTQPKGPGNELIEGQDLLTKEVSVLPTVTANKKEQMKDQKHEQIQSRGREGMPWKENAIEEESQSLKLFKEKIVRQNSRKTDVILALRRSSRLQDKEKEEESDRQPCKESADEENQSLELFKEKKVLKNNRRTEIILALRRSKRLRDKEKEEESDGESCQLFEDKSLLENIQSQLAGNKRRKGELKISAEENPPKGQSHDLTEEQNVQEEQFEVIEEQIQAEEKQIAVYKEQNQLEEQQSEVNESQNQEKVQEMMVTADQNAATEEKSELMNEVIQAYDGDGDGDGSNDDYLARQILKSFNQQQSRHDFKTYERRRNQKFRI